MIRYLLGELSPEQTDRFEEQYFTDDETFDRLLLTKADLIDLYLHGQLDERQTISFESFFLKSPDHQREVALVRSLLKMGSEAARNEPAPWTEKIEKLFGFWPVWSRATATAFAALLILISGWLMIANRRMNAELNALRAEQQIAIAHQRELEQSLAALKSQGSRPLQTPTPTVSPVPAAAPSPRGEALLATVIASIELTPGQSRTASLSAGGELPKLQIPADDANQTGKPVRPRNIKLILFLVQGTGYSSYAVKLKGQTRTGLHIAKGDVIEVEFPADKLENGEYTVTLFGITAKGGKKELDDYRFRVVR